MKIYSAQFKGTTTVATGSNVSLTGSFSGSIAGIDINATNQFTASTSTRLTNIEIISASNINRITSLETKSASVDISISNINSVTASNIARLSNLETKSSSVDISITNINSFTASNGNTSLNSKTGSYATTGSNTFYGTQTYSGSVYIANDLVVQGSSSIQYISASSVSIGTNIVQLNTANPSVRFAGLTMIDSGSVGGSGSFLYDSVQDEFIFVHRGNGTNITSSHFVLGPETYDSLGNETYLTTNILTKGTGKEHLVDSCIFDNGTTTCIKNNLVTTGTACFASTVFTNCLKSNAASGVNFQILAENLAGLEYYADNNGHNFYTYDSSWKSRLFISDTGCVGIGTISPSYRLEICGDGNGTGELAVKGTGTDIGLALNNTGTGGKAWRILSTGGGSGAGNGKLLTWDGTGYGWVMDNCRNMGIGTTTVDSYPNYTTLQVGCTNGIIQTYDGTVKTAIVSNSQGAGLMGTRTNHDLRIVSNDTERIRVTCGGNTCVYCQLSVGPVVVIGNQGGTDTTVITGGSGQGSSVRMNYAGGSYNNFLAGNGDNYFNCLLGKLNAAGGVKFGSGATTLNYYESGTWTPQIYWSNGGQYCMGGINGGNYVRIGNAVHLNFHLQWTAQCGGGSFGGTFRIGGIPFTVGSYRSAGTISAISSGIGRSDICITWHALTADPGANFIYWIENDARGGYSHSPNVSANGLAYSNQLTYTLQ